MKKRLLSLALVGVMGISLLSGCGQSAKNGGTESSASEKATVGTEASEKVAAETSKDTSTAAESGTEASQGGSDEAFTLTISSWNLADEPLGIVKAYREKFEEKFHEQYPNVVIEYNNTQGENYFDLLKAQLSSGTASDVIQMQAPQLSVAAKGGYLLDLSDMAFTEHIDGMAQDVSSVDGKIYAAPYDINSSGVWYNTKLFEELNIEVPETWAEFLQVCDTLAENDITPLAGGFMDNWVAQEVVKVTMANSYGSADFEKEVYSGEKKLNGPEVTKAYELMQEMVDKGYFGKDALSNGWDMQRKNFEDGKAGMMIHGSYVAGLVNSEMADKGGMETGFFALPAENAADSSIPASVSMLTGVNAKSEHPEAAKALLEAMYDPEAQNIRDKDSGTFPAMKNIEIDYQEKGNLIHLDVIKNTPIINQGYYFPQSVLDTFAQDFQKMLAGQKFEASWLDAAVQNYENDKELIPQP